VVFQTRTGRRLASIRVGPAISNATFDQAGDRMLVTSVASGVKSTEGPAQIRQTRGGTLLRTIPGPVAGGYLSPDGKLAAVVSPDDDVAIWDVASGRRLTTFRGNQAQPSTRYSGDMSVSFSPDG